MKVAYIIEVMYNSGGMERVLSVCANSLCQDLDVSIVTLYQKGRPTYFPLDNRIHCYDLGLEGVANRTLLKERLTEFLMSHHFDIVISMGGIDMYYLHSIKDGSRKIVWFHFAINIAETTWVGPNPGIAKKMKAKIQTWRRIYHARKYDNIVVISKADLESWKNHTDKVLCIYNPVTIDCSAMADNCAKAVISVGRLDYQKGYDYLIDTWKRVAEKHPDWKLRIFGEGPLRNQLQKQIDQQQLSTIITLCGRASNIAEKYVEHSIYVMSSRAEGFPLALLEASACGLPLIAFDCPSGPGEIIEDGRNGYLIPKVGDIEGMANAICKLIEEKELRQEMGAKALERADSFSVKKVSIKWMEVFNFLYYGDDNKKTLQLH